MTAVLLSVDKPSTILCGSSPASELKLSGKLEGDETLTKRETGVLNLNTQSQDYNGTWFLNEGSILVRTKVCKRASSIME